MIRKNKTVLVTMILFIVILTVGCSQKISEDSKVDPAKFLILTKCENPPLIDGKLDDKIWENAVTASDFKLLNEDSSVTEQTTSYITYDNENIYIAFKCSESNPDEIVSDEKKHDAVVVYDDCVEVFLDPNQDYKNYFHFIINSKGVTSDASVELLDDFIDVYYDWEPEYYVKTSIAENEWFVEMAIPFESLKTGIERPTVFKERKEEERSAFSLVNAPDFSDGAVWNINLCRRKQAEPLESSSWSPDCDKFYSPHQFGHIIFAGDLNESRISNLTKKMQKEHKRVVSNKNKTEQNRLQPVLKNIVKSDWTPIFQRNMFMGYESKDAQIPNYARLDGQGRVCLNETIPPLSKENLDKIIAKETPRFVYDKKSLMELKDKIDKNPNIKKQWLKLKEKADDVLDKPFPEIIPCEMQHDRNCVPREKAKDAGANYGFTSSVRTKCVLVYAITKDKKYAQKAWEAQSLLIDHFNKYQAFRAATNWYSIWDASYEVYNSTYIYDMIADSGVMIADDKAKLIEFIRRIGYRVNYCVKYSEMVGNHQYMWTGNFGCMALYFPEFPEQERWAVDVEARMPMLYDDILADGGQIERSPGHHIFGLNYLCKYVNANKQLAGKDIFDKEYDGKSLGQALDWMAKITTPLGEIPAINDSKRPQLSKHLFMLDIIDRFDKGEYLRAGKIDISELPLEHLISEKIEPKDPPWTSVLLPETGWAIMRDNWEEDSKYLLFDFGEHGAWHGHYDKMNFDMYADGIGWVLDAGSSPHYCVYIKEHNEWHKQTIAHNTVLIDGKSQEAVSGVLQKWETHEDFDLVSASHNGYEGINHTRTIFHPRGEYFIINDFLQSSDNKNHDYSFLLHINGDLNEYSKSSINFSKDGKGLLILPADPNGIDSVFVEEGLCIDAYGERKKPVRDDGKWTPGDPGWAYIPYIGLEKNTSSQDVNYLVVLYPYKDSKNQPEVQCEKLVGKNNNAVGIKIKHNGYVDIYGERNPDAKGNVFIEMGSVRTDADYFFIRIKDGEVVKSSVVAGTELYWKGKEIK